ncbi:MAG: (2Fe-2S) ferredoxin domain-containing protein [Cyanobacteria bacterium P01_G01_bin.54]
MTTVIDQPLQFFVCQHLTCKRQGAEATLLAFQEHAVDATVMACGCLARCGEGPTVLVRPAGEIYTTLTPERVQKMLRAYQQEQAWPRFGQPLGLLLTPAKFLMVMAVVLGASAIAFLAW